MTFKLINVDMFWTGFDTSLLISIASFKACMTKSRLLVVSSITKL